MVVRGQVAAAVERREAVVVEEEEVVVQAGAAPACGGRTGPSVGSGSAEAEVAPPLPVTVLQRQPPALAEWTVRVALLVPSEGSAVWVLQQPPAPWSCCCPASSALQPRSALVTVPLESGKSAKAPET